jgi:hypothetical protein
MSAAKLKDGARRAGNALLGDEELDRGSTRGSESGAVIHRGHARSLVAARSLAGGVCSFAIGDELS